MSQKDEEWKQVESVKESSSAQAFLAFLEAASLLAGIEERSLQAGVWEPVQTRVEAPSLRSPKSERMVRPSWVLLFQCLSGHWPALPKATELNP